MQDFNVETVELKGANIIEASAGTGKTFSIAVLVVRLLIEKNIPISKMLLVTFTEAAAAELKERSLKFIREALLELEQSGSSENEVLKNSVINALQSEQTKEEIEKKLRVALLNIDNGLMCTIHSFCQQSLNEFAFETNQEYGKKLKTDFSDITTKYINAYRREELNSLDLEIFNESELANSGVLSSAISNVLGGKVIEGDESLISSIDELKLKIVSKEEERIQFIQSKLADLINEVDNVIKEGFKDGKKNKLKDLMSSAQGAVDMFLNKVTDFVPELFPVEIQYCKAKQLEINQLKGEIKHTYIKQAITWIVPKVTAELKRKNFFTFDDLISQMHAARKYPEFQKQMRAKYEAVFVDEFQDTDKKQYAIFKELFQDDASKIMFYIGDPKQSIYSFRQADLNTYFAARNSIPKGKQFTMSLNHRSTEKLINSLNVFFQPTSVFDTFENGDITDKIEYIQVAAKNRLEIGLSGVEINNPVTIIDGCTSKPQIIKQFTNTIKYLFSGDVNLNDKPLKPSNLAVLVRVNKEGKLIKDVLTKLGIPSVLIDDTKIVTSQEAKDILFILEAVLTPSQSNIQKALLSDLLASTTKELETIDFDACVIQFITYRKEWLTKGVYFVLKSISSDFKLEKRFANNTTSGHRVLSNVQQLSELLQEKEQQESFTPSEIYTFLSQQIKGDVNENEEGSEYAQRVESDEDAVKIVTIHKSKGLEYDVVLTPFIALKAEVGWWYDFIDYRQMKGDESGYVFARNKDLSTATKNKYTEQIKQENRRLLYVALTRAKYNVFLYTNSEGNSTLKDFMSALKENVAVDIKNINEISDWANKTISYKIPLQDKKQKDLPKIVFSDANYKKISYSGLAAHPSKSDKNNDEFYEEDTYDQFIFKGLKKGAQTGNLLHDIFERINYDSDNNWEQVIRSMVSQHLTKEIDNTPFKNRLNELVIHTLNCSLKSSLNSSDKSFSLADVPRSKRVNELEFNFKIPADFLMSKLENVLVGDSRKIVTHRYAEIQGMMNGFIDLFFEHNGKYYILDWKSNFLGDSVEDYNQGNLLEAMNESNYHLQYLLYSVAINEYLTSKLPDFNFERDFGGVYYLFLRGVRSRETSGVYYQGVTLEEMNKVKYALRIGV